MTVIDQIRFERELERKLIKSYSIGSRMYGTYDKDSDFDHLTVVTEPISFGTKVKVEDRDYQFFTEDQFKRALENHSVLVIEAVYLNNDVPDDFRLDKGKLRVSFSTVANGAWIKGRKKLTVYSDYDVDMALKSIFHSIRILDYGIQLMREGKITQPDRYNWLLEDLKSLAEKYERDDLWNVIESKHKKLFKTLRSEFKRLAPKVLIHEHMQKSKLISILQAYKIQPNKKLVKEILEIFE